MPKTLVLIIIGKCLNSLTATFECSLVKHIEASFVVDGEVRGLTLLLPLSNLLTACSCRVVQGRTSDLVKDCEIGPMGQEEVHHQVIVFGYCQQQRRLSLFVQFVYTGTSLQIVREIPHSRMTKTCWESLVTCL